MRWIPGPAMLVCGCINAPTVYDRGVDERTNHDEGEGGPWSESEGGDEGDEGEGGGEDGEGGADTSAEPDLPEGDVDAPLYSECAAELGVDLVHDHSFNIFATPGQAWADIDRDGFMDLVLTNQGAANRVFMGGPDGAFTSPSWAADLALADRVSSGAVFADYDNDGWLDLYLLADGPNTLLRNLGGQGFADVSASAGVDDPGVGETAAWADIDGDGHLDLYVANNDLWPPDALYRGRGDGGFDDASGLLSLATRSRPAFSASFFDYDLDGDPDLYVANDKWLGNVLWRNDGPGCGGWCMTDVSASSGAGVELASMGLAVGDYDGDGDQDLFVTSVGPMALLQNQTAQGQPRFEDVAAEAGALIDERGWGEVGWGAQFLDYDNDGALDLYVALGKQDPGPALPNVMLRGLGEGAFAAAEATAGAADPRRSFGLAVGDYDDDGWLDLLVGNSGDRYALYRNGGAALHGARHYLSVELRAVDPDINRDAIGARVYVHDDSGRTQVRERIAGSSLGAGSSLRLHFGLGAARPASVTVVWPDGRVDQLDDPPVDATLLVEY